MQVNNNLNSMYNLEKDLEKSAKNLSKLNSQSEQNNLKKDQKELNQNQQKENDNNDVDLVKEMVKQVEIPIAYDANAQVISTQNAVHQSLLDIKA